MPTILRSMPHLWCFENNSVNAATKVLNRTSYFPVGVLPRANCYLVAARTGTLGALNYFDITVFKSGGATFFRHRVRRANWVAGQRKYGFVNLPGGISPNNTDEIAVTIDTIDSVATVFIGHGVRP